MAKEGFATEWTKSDRRNGIAMNAKEIRGFQFEKQKLEETYAEVALPTRKSHNQLESKITEDPSSAEIKHKESHNSLGGNVSDPFDESALLPEAETDDDPLAPVVTLRSILVGTLMACFGATISQIFVYKPVHLKIHVLFIQLACLLSGQLLASIQGPAWWNPGRLTMKEIVFSSIMATSGAGGALSVETIATQDVFFDRSMPVYICVLLIMSSQLIGFGWAGLFRRFLIHPKKVLFPSVLPSVALFHSLARVSPSTRQQLSFFKKVFSAVSVYEIIPNYLAPALQAISPWCLALPASPVVTRLFGGSMVAEGLGFLALSCDWVLVGTPFKLNLARIVSDRPIPQLSCTGSHSPLFVPLAAQIIDWVAVGTAIFVFNAAYRHNWFGGGNLPFISFGVLDSEGKPYDLARAIFENGTENKEEVMDMGLPAFATSYVLGKAGIAISVSSAIVASVLFSFKDLRAAFSCNESDKNSPEDPHRTITKYYRDFPTYGFLAISALAIFFAFVCSYKAQSGLSACGLAVSLILSFVLSFASGFFYGHIGVPLHCHPVVHMLGGLLFPGNAIGNMWFTLYGSTSAGQCVNMLKDLKLGQYMNISTMDVILAQLSGTIIGGFVHFGVMKSIVNTQKDVLKLANGNGVFTGMSLNSLAAQATTWGIFSQRLYFFGSKYSIIPTCLLLGFLAPFPFFFLHKWKPKAGFDRFNVSLFAASFFHAIMGVTSGHTTAAVLAIITQYWLRKYHFKWYKKYNYILSAALDGGTQLAVLLLTFLVQGGGGIKLDIPTYFLNPVGPRDYCYIPENSKRMKSPTTNSQ